MQLSQISKGIWSSDRMALDLGCIWKFNIVLPGKLDSPAGYKCMIIKK